MPLAEPLQQIDRTFVRRRGRKLVYFGGGDYFRLASHPDVLHSLSEGAQKFGLNVAASRSTTGNHAVFGELEKKLANFFNRERAALFSTGYATNLAVASAFAGRFTHTIMDERSHGSLRDAAQFSGCAPITFRHRDADDFRRVVKACGRMARPLVLTDGMFSHDGSLAPLNAYLEVLPRAAMLLVDDAHGAGTLGKTGKGTPEVCGVRDARVVQTISLSKALGVYGGAVLGSPAVIRVVQERSRVFNGNTPLPPPLANAALTSLTILRRDHSLRARLHANTARIKEALDSGRWSIPCNQSPIVSVIPRTDGHASNLSRALLRAGIFPPRIRYANRPAFFRFAISSEHTPVQLDKLAEVLTSVAH